MPRKKEDIVADGKKTQFKKGNKAAAKHGPMTYRQQLQWVRDQYIDPENLADSIKKLARPIVKGKAKINVSRMVAVRAVEKLLAKMEPLMLEKIINNTEGMLSQEIIARPSIAAPEDNLTLEEAAQAYRDFIGK